MRLVNPDRDLLQASYLVGGDDMFDIVKPIGKDAQSVVAKFLVDAGKKAVIDVDGPAFDVAFGVLRGNGRQILGSKRGPCNNDCENDKRNTFHQENHLKRLRTPV